MGKSGPARRIQRSEGVNEMRNGLVVDDGVQRWYKDDKLHKEDGPAVVWADGTQEWWREGKLHREDGPAVVRADGRQRWFREGKFIESPKPPRGGRDDDTRGGEAR